MAYITTEQVKEKRAAIKAAFPLALGWKFSITKDGNSTINVSILQTPCELRASNTIDENGNSISINSWDGQIVSRRYGYQVNEYSDALNSIGKEVVSELYDILNNGNHDKSDSMTDYFDVGWYQYVQIGHWQKGYEVVKQNPKSIERYLRGNLKKAS